MAQKPEARKPTFSKSLARSLLNSGSPLPLVLAKKLATTVLRAQSDIDS
jgi:hypothetical protein